MSKKRLVNQGNRGSQMKAIDFLPCQALRNSIFVWKVYNFAETTFFKQGLKHISSLHIFHQIIEHSTIKDDSLFA